MPTLTDEQRCTALNGRGERCGCARIIGGTVCRAHGGSAPQVRKAAERRVAAAKAAAAVAKFGASRDIDPHDALLEEVHRSAGYVSWLHAHLADNYATDSPYLALWDQERDRLARLCATAIGAGVAERQVRIAESQGLVFAQVIRGILTDLRVVDGPETAMIVQRHLLAAREIEV